MGQLSKNFTLEELIATSSGYYNTPNEKAEEKLLYTAQFLLQPIRDEFGRTDVTSGYRSGQVNAWVKSKPTSQQTKGEAADFQPKEANIDVVFDWIVEVSGIAFGQAILESKIDKDKKLRRWIHVSLPRLDKPNRVALIFNNGKYVAYNHKPYQ